MTNVSLQANELILLTTFKNKKKSKNIHTLLLYSVIKRVNEQKSELLRMRNKRLMIHRNH